MDEPRKGRQTPTQSVVLPYTVTFGQEAVDIYNSTGRTAQEWQELMVSDIMAVNVLLCSKSGASSNIMRIILNSLMNSR